VEIDDHARGRVGAAFDGDVQGEIVAVRPVAFAKGLPVLRLGKSGVEKPVRRAEPETFCNLQAMAPVKEELKK
jgi:hypothetical protein